MVRGFGFVVVALVLAGCSRKGGETASANGAGNGAGNAAPNSPAEPKKPEPAPLNVATTGGSADKRDEKSGKRLYSIAWKTALITLGPKGLQEGTMNAVTGTIYQEEKPKSTFSAETGYAKKETKTLRLERRVTVRSTTSKLVLTAEKLEWLPDVKRLRASGNVLVTDGSTAMRAPVLDATPDLRKVGTPDAFSRLP